MIIYIFTSGDCIVSHVSRARYLLCNARHRMDLLQVKRACKRHNMSTRKAAFRNPSQPHHVAIWACVKVKVVQHVPDLQSGISSRSKHIALGTVVFPLSCLLVTSKSIYHSWVPLSKFTVSILSCTRLFASRLGTSLGITIQCISCPTGMLSQKRLFPVQIEVRCYLEYHHITPRLLREEGDGKKRRIGP